MSFQNDPNNSGNFGSAETHKYKGDTQENIQGGAGSAGTGTGTNTTIGGVSVGQDPRSQTGGLYDQGKRAEERVKNENQKELFPGQEFKSSSKKPFI